MLVYKQDDLCHKHYAITIGHQKLKLFGRLYQPNSHENWCCFLVIRKTTTGGNALKFYASVRLDIRRVGSIKNGDEVIMMKLV